jgi:hypothetical protein
LVSEGSFIVGTMTIDIGPLAARRRAEFGAPGVHARVRSGRTVHAVRLGLWVRSEAEEQVPELACHTGVAGWDPSALEPTREDVTCARCVRILGGESRSSSQLPLWRTD